MRTDDYEGLDDDWAETCRQTDEKRARKKQSSGTREWRTPQVYELPRKKSRRFNLIPFNELRPRAAPTYLIKGLIPRVGLTVVWGPPKCGKSFMVFDQAMHVALGWDYRGRRVHKGPVVYCAFEGADGFRARAHAFRLRHLAEHRGPVDFYLMPARANLVADHSVMIADIRAQLPPGVRPAMVVLDTLNRSLQGSESSDEDMAAYIKAADAIREAFGCAVVIVHHCGIDASRPRGHTSLTGSVDAQLAVKRDAAGNIVAEVEWMKDGPEGEAFSSRLDVVDVGTDDDGDTIRSCVVVPAEGPTTSAGKNKKKLTAKALAGLRHLHECLADRGRLVPDNTRVPAGIKAVTTKEWREHLEKAGVNGKGNPREELSRICVTLTNAGYIGIWEDFAWASHSVTSPSHDECDRAAPGASRHVTPPIRV